MVSSVAFTQGGEAESEAPAVEDPPIAAPAEVPESSVSQQIAKVSEALGENAEGAKADPIEFSAAELSESSEEIASDLAEVSNEASVEQSAEDETGVAVEEDREEEAIEPEAADEEISAEEGVARDGEEPEAFEEEGEALIDQVPLPELSDEESAEDSDGEKPGVLPTIEATEGTAIIRGEVFAASGDGLPGVMVTIPSIDRSTRTDQDGLFTFADLPGRELIVKFNKLGYIVADRTVVAEDDEVIEVSQALEEQPVEFDDGEYELDEVEVLGEYEEEEEFSIEIDRSAAPAFVSAIGKEEFTKQSVSNAAEAIGKVSGANIVDGKYAVVRGLADRYVTTTFNNGVITSADPSRKTIQLDLLPTSVIQGISVSKTYDASMPGDFGGGAINVQSLGMPSEPFLTFKYKLEWNSNLEGDFYRHPDRDLGYWGTADSFVDAGIGDLPNPRTTSPEVVDAAWDTLLSNAAFRGSKSKARAGQDYGVSYGDIFDFGNGNRLGVVAGFSHKEKDTMLTDVFRSPTPAKPRSYIQDQYSSIVDWSAFLSGQLELGEYHTLQATYFKKRNTEDSITVGREVVDGSSLNFGTLGDSDLLVNGLPGGIPGYGAPAGIYGEFWDVETTVRDLELFQVVGDHQFGEDGVELSWGLTSNRSSEVRPNSTTLNYSVLDFADERLNPESLLQSTADSFNTAFSLGLVDPSYQQVKDEILAQGLLPTAVFDGIEAGLPPYSPELGQVPTFAHDEYIGASPPPLKSYIQQQAIREDTKEMFADVAIPIDIGRNRTLRLKTGFRGSQKERQSRAKVYELDVNEVNDADLYTPGGIGSEATQNTDLLTDLTTGLDGTNLGATISDVTNQQIRNFDGSSNILGIYGAADLEIENYNLSAGLRFEREDRSFYADPDENDPSVQFLPDPPDSIFHYLPSVSGKASFLDGKLTVGAFYSRTVARPTFFEYLPAKTVDQATGFVRSGNPSLTDTGVTNFDLSVEYLITDKTRIAIAPFSKNLADPIVAQANLSEGTIVFTNGTGGNLQGIELEFESAEWDRWTLRGNYTYIESELTSLVNVGVAGTQSVSQKYPGQPAHILNLSLGYEIEEWGFNANLIYNYTGDSLLYRRFSEDEPFIVAPGFHQVDFNVSKVFDFEDWSFTTSFTIKNLLNSGTQYYFEEGSSVYDGQIFDEYRPGRTYQIEGKISF